MSDLTSSEGFIKVPGGRVWYRTVGAGEGIPLLVLHGGPGYPHDYLESLQRLSEERRVVFYDQLGCGRSERPDDPALWTVERAVLELIAVRKALDLTKVHLLGHSWGSMLALDYALTWPEGLCGIVFSSPCISIPMWVEDSKKLRSQLPPEMNEALTRGQEEGRYDSPEYQQATTEYYRRFLDNYVEKPECVRRSDYGSSASVYNTMWGPNEFTVTGTLKDYDRCDRLQDLRLPVLYTCGAFDEATPETTRHYQSLTPDSEIVVFEASAHLPHVAEEERFVTTVGDFFRHIEEKQHWNVTMTQELERSSFGIFFCLLAVGFALVVLATVFLL